MKDIPHRRREQAHKAFRIGLALLVIISLPIGIAAAQTADEPDPCPDGPPIRGDSGTVEGIEVVLVNDRSDSMNQENRLGELKNASTGFLDRLEEQDEAGSVSWASTATLDQELTTNKTAVKDSINALTADEVGQNLDGGIDTAREELINGTNATDAAPKIMVVVTDAASNNFDDGTVFDAANATKDAGITIVAISLGSEADTTSIQRVASEGYYYDSPNSTELEGIYEQISEDVEQIRSGLAVETRDLYQPGETHEYTVYEIVEVNNRTTRTDVTSQATLNITSAYNGTLLTVGSGTLTAVNDDTVSDWARVDARYNGSQGCTNVIVSTPSVENIELVPGIWRLNALIGDSTIFFILLATLAAVAMTRFSSSFGGIAVAQVVMTVGWLAGYVPWAYAAASLFIGLFIGLNLAANIDYSVARFKP